MASPLLLQAAGWRVGAAGARDASRHGHGFKAAGRRGYRAFRARAAQQSPEPDAPAVAATPEAAPAAQQPVAPAPAPAPAPAAEQAGSSGGFLAGGAAGLGVALFLVTRVLGGGPSFAALEAGATPIDVALSNGKPTVIEFFADYCEVCRELLPETLAAQRQFGDRVNFVMLNVENSAWAPEVLEYGVNGIPHFAFLDGQGQLQAAAVGKLPAEVLQGDLQALAEGKPLPFARVRGQASPMQRPETTMMGPSKQAGPLDHF